MNDEKKNQDEIQRRRLQEYIFALEERQDQAEDLAVENERIKQVQYLLNAILDATSNGICLITDGKILWCNQGVADIFGWENNEIVGKSANILFLNADEYARMNALIDGSTPKTEVITFESDFAHKNGSRISCLVTHRPLYSMDISKGYIISFTDFTERKRAENRLKAAYDELEDRVEERTEALNRINKQLQLELAERKRIEEALKESEEKYHAVLESNPDPVVVYDMEGKVIYFNPAFTRVFGWNLKERFAKKMDSFVPEENWPETQKMIEKVMAGDSFSGVETYRYNKAGRIIPVSVSGAIFKSREGNPAGSVINLRDISKQKQLEARLRRAQKMEAIGTLAGGVAHDLNNILSGIVSYPELLLLDLPPESSLRKPILTIQKSGMKAAAIVQDLLTLARRGVAVTEVIDLNHIIFEYLKSPEYEKLRSFYPNLNVKTDLAADLLNIMGSSVHLTKTIMNLVSNGFEAMPNGGKATITTKNQYVDKPIRGYDEVKEGDYVVLSMADDGVGISSEDIERIFEPFYTKKVIGRSGTGLGMAVVWGTVKDHHGYIDVRSSVGNGTTFTLYFPVTRKEVSTDPSIVSIDDYMGRGESILVVDDVEEQREIATGILRKLGYAVQAVSNGEEAVEYMQKNAADLVVLDMIMEPGINGRETYEQIIKIRPGQKAVIASGFSETDDVKQTQKLGAGKYIKKPYTIEKIGIAVRDELQR